MTERAEAVLRVEQAVGGYGDLTILHGVDLAIRSGSWTTIIGANGAGKSTLLKLVAGIVGATSGRVIFEGVDVTAVAPVERLRRGIGLVPQGRCNFPLLSVAENLKLGAWTRTLARSELERELDRITTRFPAERTLVHAGGQFERR